VVQDPEGILSAPKAGHIARRQLQKRIADDQSLAEQLERERQKAEAELQARRDVSHYSSFTSFNTACPSGVKNNVRYAIKFATLPPGEAEGPLARSEECASPTQMQTLQKAFLHILQNPQFVK
jgi:hypothetical protein